MPPEQTDMAVHHRLVQQLIDRGRISSSAELATELGVTHSELDASFLRLAASHSLVLHPHKNEPWVIHPFSLSPTHTWVSRGERGWWAPCLWCGLGSRRRRRHASLPHRRRGGSDPDRGA